VVEGGTLRIGAERIWLIDIDAPEMASSARCDAERNLAELAKSKLAEIIAGQRLARRRAPNLN
jgi:endonuclease YncB( thermonuclease family)